jgi:hypothetical protein
LDQARRETEDEGKFDLIAEGKFNRFFFTPAGTNDYNFWIRKFLVKVVSKKKSLDPLNDIFFSDLHLDKKFKTKIEGKVFLQVVKKNAGGRRQIYFDTVFHRKVIIMEIRNCQDNRLLQKLAREVAEHIVEYNMPLCLESFQTAERYVWTHFLLSRKTRLVFGYGDHQLVVSLAREHFRN